MESRLDDTVTFVITGFAGGLVYVLGAYGFAFMSHDQLPHQDRAISYVIVQLFFGASGAFLVWAHIKGGAELTTLLALNIGITGPMLIYTGFSQVRDKVRPNID